jgi:hypothetical protein
VSLNSTTSTEDKHKRQRRLDANDTSDTTDATLELTTQQNRGPLLTTTLALFGYGSFIAERMERPEAYLYPNMTWEEYKAQPNPSACVGKAPFVGLLHTDIDSSQTGSYLEGCLKNDVYTHDYLQRQVASYVKLFYYNVYGDWDGERITNAFTSAAFIANEAWLNSPEGGWTVSCDYGADTTVPVISPTGIIVISVLMGTFLSALLALAIYSALLPRWTDQLDAFAMLRIGASISGDVQFRAAEQTRKIEALDRLPGWIGDATDGEGERGQLALGARGRLNWKRKFLAYDLGENV